MSRLTWQGRSLGRLPKRPWCSLAPAGAEESSIWLPDDSTMLAHPCVAPAASAKKVYLPTPSLSMPQSMSPASWSSSSVVESMPTASGKAGRLLPRRCCGGGGCWGGRGGGTGCPEGRGAKAGGSPLVLCAMASRLRMNACICSWLAPGASVGGACRAIDGQRVPWTSCTRRGASCLCAEATSISCPGIAAESLYESKSRSDSRARRSTFGRSCPQLFLGHPGQCNSPQLQAACQRREAVQTCLCKPSRG